MIEDKLIFPILFETDEGAVKDIINLNHYLRELQVDLAIKLARLDDGSDANESQKKRHLSTLAQEVEWALQGIDDVVNIAVAEES